MGMLYKPPIKTQIRHCEPFTMSFDPLAPIYRLMERVFAGGKMQCCRVAFLDNIPEPHNILLLGEGHGRFLIPCRMKFPKAAITCVDASSGMIAQARQSLARSGLAEENIQFIQRNILEWSPPDGAFDLIVTHFFLDCFREDQLAILIPKLAQAAMPNAHWLVADFQIVSSGLKRLRCRMIVSMLYAFFRVATHLSASKLIDPDPFFERAGFTLHRRIEEKWGLLRSDWWW